MIILASKSPRRIELLKDAGINFIVDSSDIEEVIDETLTPMENAMNIAYMKASDVLSRHKDDLVIAADTMVVLKTRIFGKPKNEKDAYEILKALSNQTHQVITGVVIMNKEKVKKFYSVANVKIKNLTDLEIYNYIDTKEPFDKAGAYAIQGIGKNIVETYDGDFLTIVGLPLKDVLETIKEF